MAKIDIFLQLAVISLVAAIVSLITLRLYPLSTVVGSLAPQEAYAQTIISPYVETPIQYPVMTEKIAPTTIFFADLDLTLPVAPGSITGSAWTLYDDKVSWLETSAVPGSGNVILYAHNKEHLFGNLDTLRLGSKIIVVHNEKTYEYLVKEIKKISPHDIDAILSHDDQLTLYTCDGAFDQKRLVVTSVPITP